MQIEYQSYQAKNRSELVSLIHSLYNEDPDGEAMTDDKIAATIQFLSDNPRSGEILLFTKNETVLGYSILINYWSNEFGGLILFVDELYLKSEYRNKNIGTDFLKFIFNKKNEGYKALFLEVFPSNNRAYDFYIRNGFFENEGSNLRYVL